MIDHTFQPHEVTIQDLLERVDFNQSLESVVDHVADKYSLESILEIRPLLVGHEELNCEIVTTKGRFVIKFLNKRKSRSECEANITAMVEFDRANIPVPSMVSFEAEEYLYALPQEYGRGYLFVMEYFEGNTFNQMPATKEDIQFLSSTLGNMHSLKFQTGPEYDNWLLIHFPEEFGKKAKYLSEQDHKLVSTIVEQYKQVDLRRLTKGIVHYDLHRDNVQKSPDGEYAIFDLATVDFGYVAFDLATFIGLFVMRHDVDWEENEQTIRLCLEEYQKVRTLEVYELESLPTLIRSIQAANILAANYLMVSGEDNTTETYRWYELGSRLLRNFGSQIESMQLV